VPRANALYWEQSGRCWRLKQRPRPPETTGRLRSTRAMLLVSQRAPATSQSNLWQVASARTRQKSPRSSSGLERAAASRVSEALLSLIRYSGSRQSTQRSLFHSRPIVCTQVTISGKSKRLLFKKSSGSRSFDSSYLLQPRENVSLRCNSKTERRILTFLFITTTLIVVSEVPLTLEIAQVYFCTRRGLVESPWRVTIRSLLAFCGV